MDESEPPIDIQDLLQLQNVGIAANHITWTRVTMTSDSHICLRCRKIDQGTKEEVIVLDLQTDSQLNMKLPNQSECCMVSPIQIGKPPLLALNYNEELRVSNLQSGSDVMCKIKIKGLHYWTWLNHSNIGIVTNTSVLKWNVRQEPVPEPEFVFNISSRLIGLEIISLKADNKLAWYALTGLHPQDPCISSLTELYCVEKKLSQCIGVFAVCFCYYQFGENNEMSTVMCAASRDDTGESAQGKVHIVELDNVENLAPTTRIEHITFPEDSATKFDFPTAVHVSSELGLIYILSKYGYFFLIDIETAACLYSTIISEDVIFASTMNPTTQGVLAINTGGKVMGIDVRPQQLIQHVKDNLRNKAIAERLESILPKADVSPSRTSDWPTSS